MTDAVTLAGKEPEIFVGQLRDGHGIPFEVMTWRGAQRLLLFSLRDWQTSSYLRLGLDYDLSLDVMDDAGTVLGSRHIVGNAINSNPFPGIAPRQWWGGQAAKWFAEKIGQLVDSEEVAGVLSKSIQLMGDAT
jgi:hypothetical protein